MDFFEVSFFEDAIGRFLSVTETFFYFCGETLIFEHIPNGSKEKDSCDYSVEYFLFSVNSLVNPVVP